MSAPRGKPMTWKTKLICALRRFGLTLDDVQFDHQPQLAMRDYDPIAKDTIPSGNDPDSIQMLTLEEHRRKTHGTKATSAGSDAHARAKNRRLTGKNKPKPKKHWPSREIPSRPFEARRPKSPMSRGER